MNRMRQVFPDFGQRWRRVPRKWRWAGGILAVVTVLAYTAAYLMDEPLRAYVEREANHRLTGYSISIHRLSVHPHTLSFDVKDATLIQDANPKIPIADIHRLKTTIHWRALLHGRLVADMTFVRPKFHLDPSHFQTEAASTVPLKDKGWQQALEAIALDMKINKLEVRDGDVTYVDQGPFKPLHLSRIKLMATNIRNIESPDRVYPSTIRLSAVVFDNGTLEVDGHADFLDDPHPGILARLELDQIELDYFKPVINRVNLTVRKGVLATAGTVEYAPSIKSLHLEKVLVRGPEIEYFHTPQTAAAESQRAQATVSAAKQTSNAPGVKLQVDRVEIVNGNFAFTSRAANPPYRVTLTDAALKVDNLSNQQAQGSANVQLSGKLMGSGQTVASAAIRAATGGADVELKVKVEDTEMTRMNDLVRAYGGFGVEGGDFSVYTELNVKNGMISGYVKPLFRDVQVAHGEQDQPKGLGQKLYEGAVAVASKILKNRARGEVATVVTVSGRVEQPQTNLWEVVGKLIENAFIKAILPGFEGEERKQRS
jgi:hypothetical protein